MFEPSADIRRQAEALVEKGYRYLEDEEYDEALECAAQLEELGYSGAYELAALTFTRRGELERAIEALERGVKMAPDAWVNWHLLGDLRAEDERWQDSEAAYEQALGCADVWAGAIRISQAETATRQGQFDRALGFLDEVDDPDFKWETTKKRVLNLMYLESYAAALELSTSALGEDLDDLDVDDYSALAEIAAMNGWARAQSGHPVDEIRQSALEHLGWFGVTPDGLDLIREVDERFADEAVAYRLMLAGVAPDEEEQHGFYVTQEVLASSEQEAFAFAEEIENAVGAVELQVEEIQALEMEDPEGAAEMALGVLWRSGRAMFDLED